MKKLHRYPKHKIAIHHIPKCGGTSLKEYIGVSVLGYEAEKYKGKHIPLKYIYDEVKDYNIISSIRNPYERVVSLYEFRRKKYNRLKNKKMIRIAFKLDFKSWVKKWLIPKSTSTHSDTSISNSILVGGKVRSNLTIVKLEDVSNGVNDFFEKLGIRTDSEFPHRNRTVYKDWKEYYDDETVEIIYNWDKYVCDHYYKK